MGAMTPPVYQLFVLNVALQLFDGVASYQGVPHWGEANPLVREAMVALGIGPALLLFKAEACGLLLLVGRLRAPEIAWAVYAALAVAYGTMSFLPWAVRFGALLVG